MDFFKGKLKDYEAGMVLDFGTGAGGSAMALKDAVKRLEHVTGIDTLSPEQHLFEDLLTADWFSYVQHDRMPLPFPTGSYDTVLMSNVLHHLPDELRGAVFSELRRVLKPGGSFLFVEFFRDQLEPAQKTQFYFHTLRAEMDRAAGKHHYLTLLRSELEQLVDSWGFAHTEVHDYASWREDFKDRANLDNIARFIDDTVEGQKDQARYAQYRRFADTLKQRMYRTGYSAARVLVAICR